MKQTIIYGTGNPAKLASMRKVLAGFELKIIGAKETHAALPDDNSINSI
ncbi:hypothetical protein Dtox_0643 [Desulfofarcimen acetoxidans DSM 771]|jgi:hypothetical protein|uniref:Uncharacterized protein n=1 Tax=Desulfofarcimen acetoxidans (strain ATCC 49208 / DSM 771 / KCTC 5769 / VKM B-1644 / 5575) TaxID=485916 RepID=C8W1B7_DESAS|nr:hypothetical protein [Desulfofarcimen acetoxidans]ACV61562.1 hypothetical protein Dtox_0643 [Desulfofarcimen acetoxidans DSM 771]